MELDNIKDLWNAENATETPEISLEKQKEIRMPLEKIRRIMRREFYRTIIVFVFLIIFLAVKKDFNMKFMTYMVAMVCGMAMVTAFYYVKFFKLYKELGATNLSMKESLRDLDFQLKLNKQYYICSYVAFVPYILCEGIIIFTYIPGLKNLSGSEFLLSFIGFSAMMLVIFFLSAKFRFGRAYGKYIAEFEKTLNIL